MNDSSVLSTNTHVKDPYGSSDDLSSFRSPEDGPRRNVWTLGLPLPGTTGIAKVVRGVLQWVPDYLSRDDVIIAVMGPTGSGKSSFIRSLTGEDVMVGHDLRSCTVEVRSVSTPHPNGSTRRVILLDTPGFDDTSRKDVEILGNIAEWLAQSYRSRFKISGVLYLTRISDNRMTGTTSRNLRMFRHFCGRKAFKNVVLVSTMWNEVQGTEGAEREKELNDEYWKDLIAGGARTARYDGTKEGGLRIIKMLTKRKRVTLQIQKELVDEGKELRETKAGGAVEQDLAQLFDRQKQELEAIDEEHRRAEQDHDEEMKKAMDEVKAHYESRLAETWALVGQLRGSTVNGL